MPIRGPATIVLSVLIVWRIPMIVAYVTVAASAHVRQPCIQLTGTERTGVLGIGNRVTGTAHLISHRGISGAPSIDEARVEIHAGIVADDRVGVRPERDAAFAGDDAGQDCPSNGAVGLAEMMWSRGEDDEGAVRS